MAYEETKQIDHFYNVSESQEKDILSEAVLEKTKKANKYWLCVLRAFCFEKTMVVDLSTCSASHFNDYLKKFYAGLQMQKGEKYQPRSYLAARSAVQQHLAALGRPSNLRNNETINRSNQLLDAVLKVNKVNSKTKPMQHKG